MSRRSAACLAGCFFSALSAAPLSAFADDDGGTSFRPAPPLPPDASDDGGAGAADAGAGRPDIGGGGEDAAIPPDAGAGCGPIRMTGECNGTVLTFCNEGIQELVTVDCAVEFNPTSVCTLINATYGYDCAEAVGTSCLFQDEMGELTTLFCDGTNAGCIEASDEATCLPNLGPCADTEIGGCDGDRLTFDCAEGQPYLIQCDSYDGRCRDGACRDLPATQFCDDASFFCAQGLACVRNFCVPAQIDTDAGITDDATTGGNRDATAGGGGSGDASSGCGCSTAKAEAPHGIPAFSAVFAIFALFALAARRR